MMRASVLLLGAVALAAATPAPDTFKVVFETDVALGDGQIVLNVTKSLAPIGAQRVWDLVNAKFFDEAAFFRVVPQYVVQFGIAGNPVVEQRWDSKVLPADPVKASNLKGTLALATRTTQLYVNYADNKDLDAQGFAPFGVVTKGLDVAVAVFNPTPGDKCGIDPNDYKAMGNAWLRVQYPKANFIKTARIA